MEKISITQGLSFFKTPKIKQERTVASHSNPFGVSFNNNVLQADVFQSQIASDKSSNPFTVFTSNLDNFKNSINAKKDSAISFGRNIKTGMINAWAKANQTEIKFNFAPIKEKISHLTDKIRNFDFKSNIISFKNDIIERITDLNTYKVSNLVKRPVDDLAQMLSKELKKAA